MSRDKFVRSEMPVCEGFEEIKFPDVYENKLSNGINILVLEDRKIPIISTRILLSAGSINDSVIGKNKSGVSSLVAEMLTKGTLTRSAEDISNDIEYYGADLNANANHDSIFISSKSLTKYFSQVFDILCDVVLNSVFSNEELNKVKTQRLNNLLYYNNHGKFLSSKIFIKNVHKNSPYSDLSIGDQLSIESIIKEDIISYYNKFFNPSNVTIAFIGDISPEEAFSVASDKFSNWKSHVSCEIKINESGLKEDIEIYILNKKEFVQSDIYLGHVSTPLNNPDYIPMIVLNSILGGTFTSRLNKILREKSGYTYGISSSFNLKKYTGEFVVATSVNTDVTANSSEIILNELRSIVSEKVSEDELRNAKNYLMGSFPLQMETSNSIAASLLRLKFYQFEKDFYNTLFSKIEKLNTGDILNAARKHIHPENVIISISGNAGRFSKSMEQFGKVTVLESI
jgi:zinc protease